MNVLLDTNLLIRLEPTSRGDVELGFENAVKLVRLLQEGGHRIFRHPVLDREVLGDRNTDRADLRSRLVQIYSSLDAVPLHHKVRHDEYFDGRNIGHAYVVGRHERLKRPRTLESLGLGGAPPHHSNIFLRK